MREEEITPIGIQDFSLEEQANESVFPGGSAARPRNGAIETTRRDA